MSKTNYRCSFCDQRFVREHNYTKHRCKEMIRSEEVSTLEGQRAYGFFQDWFRYQKRAAPGIDKFIDSAYYTPMFSFAAFVKKLNIPDAEIYIKLMIEYKIQPAAWSTDIAYAHFIKYVDRRLAAASQMEITVNTILDFCDEEFCEPSEFFDVITPNTFLKLVLRRKLSPWILYHSEKFLHMYSEGFSEYHQDMFTRTHPPKEWEAKFRTKPKQVELMKKVIKELEL